MNASVPTLTVVAVHPPAHAFTDPSGFVAGADEVIEVGGAASGSLKAAAERTGVVHRFVSADRRVCRQLNLGISFASSEWIALSYSDESLKPGWVLELKRLLAGETRGVLLVTARSGRSSPLVVVRRAAFVYGALDERFLCDRLSALHWVHRIYAQAARRVAGLDGIAEHHCDWLGEGWSICDHPIVGLLELWADLSVNGRAALIGQALVDPKRCWEDLRLQEKLMLERSGPSDAYRRQASYRAKEFWETNTADYVKWEVYQPDEPEIRAVVVRTAPRQVLELGCGAGRNIRYFSGSERYAGVDLSMNLLRRAVDRQEPNSIGLVCGDVTGLCFADAAFDLVFADSTIQHVPPDAIEQCVAEILRVSARYIAVIEYTAELDDAGTWFRQVHMFAHDYARLLAPHADLLWRIETAMRVHPAKKEVFLFEKRRGGHA
ncbi:MAG: class I SAM-dependent methyltransferase [Nitrospirales bacterium]|nr:class I SAM-dependent methyltransferase [Nitrospirales bacterium]